PPSCPVPRYEPWGLRYAGYNVLAHLAPGGLWVVDRERGYDCMHGCVLSTDGGGRRCQPKDQTTRLVTRISRRSSAVATRRSPSKVTGTRNRSWSCGRVRTTFRSWRRSAVTRSASNR